MRSWAIYGTISDGEDIIEEEPFVFAINFSVACSIRDFFNRSRRRFLKESFHVKSCDMINIKGE